MRVLVQPAATAEQPSVRCNGCTAALLLSGLLGDRQRDLPRLHKFVVLPLISSGFAVQTFACFNTTDLPVPEWWPNVHNHFESFSGQTRMVVQTARLASCWNHAVRHSAAFDLFVYSRPDMLWWNSLPLPSLDHVVVRAREIRLTAGEQIFQQQVSIPCSTTRVYRGSISTAEDLAAPDDCFFVDDQLALVPARFAAAFFDGSARDSNARSCDPGIFKGCSLPIAKLKEVDSTERALTERLQASCIPTMIHPFNVSLGLKRPKAQNAHPGGSGELRTLSPGDVWNNIRCASTTSSPQQQLARSVGRSLARSPSASLVHSVAQTHSRRSELTDIVDSLHLTSSSPVWIDVGTAKSSEFEVNLHDDPKLFVIGIEPTPSHAARQRSTIHHKWLRWGSRFALLERACVACHRGRSHNITMLVHKSFHCNSLLETTEGHAPTHVPDCFDDKPEQVQVRTITLDDILETLEARSISSVQLLKLDVQGMELPCLQGAAKRLRMVDNIFIEVQDLPSAQLMYKNSSNIGDVDAWLAPFAFKRQYCEVNTPEVAELNCLYTQQGRSPLWVTSRPLPSRVPRVYTNLSTGASIPLGWRGEGIRWVKNLTTASTRDAWPRGIGDFYGG